MNNTQREIRDCNVIVTGGLGFLGSHLVKYLIEERKCNVLVLDNLITGKEELLHLKATFKWCDITHSERELISIFKEFNTDYVFQYAAEPYIPVSFKRPLHVFDINARGALMVMNAAQEAGVKGILQVSSAEIYGDAPEHPINEEYPARPHSTYGSSKLAIDALVQARWREAQTPCIAMRQFNCLGENDLFHPYVIPEIIKQLQVSDTVRLGNNTFRDFQYAGDAVAMAVELLEKGQFGEVYNMGSQGGAKIFDIAKMIGEIMGKEITIEVDQTKVRPWDINHLQSDNTKLYSVIEGRPKVSFREGLERTVNDYILNNFNAK